MIDRETISAALALSAALGGARVTVSGPLAYDVARALGQEIRAGLTGPGMPLEVTAVTVTGDPTRVESVTVTLSGQIEAGSGGGPAEEERADPAG